MSQTLLAGLAAWRSSTAYNIVFAMPPLLPGGTFLLFGKRIRPTFERWGGKLRAGAAQQHCG